MEHIDIDIEQYISSYLKSFDRFEKSKYISFRPAPSRVELQETIFDIFELLFPGRSGQGILNKDTVVEFISKLMKKVTNELEKHIYLGYFYENPSQLEDDNIVLYKEKARETTIKFLQALPEIRIKLKEDAIAAFDGDPAATSIQETILTYPGICALTMHRIANFLYREGVPLIPRMFSEIIHNQTGIDIHPGASIGRSLFIDHGTGVVIGETTVIGNHVKMYQGVTLGALSFPKDACGRLIRDQKRHPTIEDYVTIYANAAILGDVTIGEHTIIGSNSWIHHDIPSFSFVQNEEPKTIIRERGSKKKATIFSVHESCGYIHLEFDCNNA